MTKRGKDHKAFEAVYTKLYEPETPPSFIRGSYMEPSQNVGWRFWQAARDHYAPKQTGKEAVEAAAKALYGDKTDHCFLEETKQFLSWENQRDEFKATYRELAIAALRAAGVRFKEEA